MKLINEQEYKDLVENSKGIVMLDFFATWCNPCRLLGDVLLEVEDETKVPLYKMDVDECMDVPRKFGVMSIPTVAIFRDGKFQEKFVGYRDKDEVREILNKYL